MIDIERLRVQLTQSDALREHDQVVTDTVDGIRPQFADDWPSALHPTVRRVLVDAGISRPYQHQADAIAQSLAGTDVVLESPTASGKTLAFTAPILDCLKRNPGSHALMIYPMKALAFDQRTQIDQLCRPLGFESFPYDGDTPTDIKNTLRGRPPHILFTNPEYLNMSFLGWRDQWSVFLRNIGYVVIDEMHEYRGFFGGNMALLLRRFFLHLKRIGASPRVFLSTATCANPIEHAKNLTGRTMAAVSARDVLRPKRHFMFVKPDIPDYQYWDILQVRIVQAALVAVEQGLQILVFCPTKKFLESAFRNCRRKVAELGESSEVVSAFHADLDGQKRQDTQHAVRSGDVRVVFATNALELGLDIGGLDGVILAGFPSSVMSAWQQIGRAGRNWSQDAFVLFYAMNDPIDRFFVGNLSAFLNKPFDELVIDPGNETLIENHLAMLTAETEGAMDPSAETILGKAFFSAAIANPGRVPRGRFKPHARLNMRGGIGESFELRAGAERVGQIGAMRRFREAYIGAIFTFFGRKYIVHSHEENAVVMSDVDQNLKTEARFFTIVTENDIFDGVAYGELEVYYGSLTVVTNFAGYKTVDERTGEEKGGGGSGAAHFQNRLHAFWVDIPADVAEAGAIGGFEHLIRVGAMFVIPADRFDTSTYSRVGDSQAIYCYENYSGGIGVSKKLFGVWQDALKKGIEVAENCQCRSGCPNCIEPAKSYNISNADIDKIRGVELARHVLSVATRSPDGRFRNGRIVPV
jgi:DEAD/DEAH box helicase domain-containing protein